MELVVNHHSVNGWKLMMGERSTETTELFEGIVGSEELGDSKPCVHE